MKHNFEYPLILYLDDNARENYFKSQNWNKTKPAKVVILDNNPLSIAMYMEEHPEIDFDESSDLSSAEMFKLNKMLKEKELKNMSAQEIIDIVGKKW